MGRKKVLVWLNIIVITFPIELKLYNRLKKSLIYFFLSSIWIVTTKEEALQAGGY